MYIEMCMPTTFGAGAGSLTGDCSGAAEDPLQLPKAGCQLPLPGALADVMGIEKSDDFGDMGMDQYLLIPFLVG
jgi:hypothetical protein